MSSIQIGVINWDSALPPDTFFGHYMVRSLSPACYRDRVPYYADVASNGTSLTFRVRTAADFDRELQYAMDAGIDYFAYVWYGEEKLGELGYAPTDPTYVSDKVWELSALRKMHADSPLRDRIRLCAILSVHPFTDAELHRLAREMQQTYYQQYNGRPLTYLYSGYRKI